MQITEGRKKYFTKHLVNWHSYDNDRSLPWKSEKDPYKIWLSEIILQQTRALQGLPYYLKFTETYPTIKDLATAADEDVFRIWQGLGYYNRCKNMLATARYIANELDGVFPVNHDAILGLKGVGAYTAAAIASFAYGLPHAVVDGNVYRVLSRYFGIEMATDTTEGKKLFAGLALELLDATDSSAYNQAIMDLGAMVCTPRNPKCNECPLQKNCVAFHDGLTAVLPVKSKKIAVATRYFNYLVFRYKDLIWVTKRSEKDIWANLHEPYLIETDQPLTLDTLLIDEQFIALSADYSNIEFSGSDTQKLTHRIVKSNFFTLELNTKVAEIGKEGMWLTVQALPKIAFPKTVLSFLKNNLYF